MVKYYKVGGCVRDEFLGVKSKDIDYAVEANSYEEMKVDLLLKGTIIWQERPEFFAIRGKHPEFGNVDFTLCRKEGFYSDGRHPDSVEIGTIYDDLARRDFTVNAMAVLVSDDPHQKNELIDPHGGLGDLNDNILRCVGDPYDRFSEDSVRILRAMRFHIVRGFKVDHLIESIGFSNLTVINGLRNTSVERIYDEVKKCYEYNTWETILFLRQYEFLEYTIFSTMGLGLTPRLTNVF